MGALKRSLVLGALLIAALGGCGGDGDGLLGAVGGPASAPNATDAGFARAMVAHEKQTGALAELARGRALRRELRKFAKATLKRQRDELPRFLEAVEDLTRRGIPPAGPPRGTPGVDPRRLRDSTAFDHEFLVMMIRASDDAVAGAEVEQDRGGDGRLRRLAHEIVESRGRDLEQLRRWLHTWYGESTVPGVDGVDPTDPGGGEDPQV